MNHSVAAPAVHELRIVVRDLDLAMRVWGPADGLPVVALHGWLDNAASFDRLAALLPDFRIYAVDLPGHGHSGHRPAQGSYNIWDDLPDLLCLFEELGLRQPALLGHSRGGIIAVLLAAAVPERVRRLALLDAIYPPPLDDEQAAQQLRRFALDFAAKPPPGRCYHSVEAAVAARVRATGSAEEATRPIVLRNLLAVEHGWLWRTDPRLRYASAMKFNTAQITAVLASVKAPSLLVAASGGLGTRPEMAQMQSQMPGLEVMTIDGEHHCHMLAQAQPIAARLAEFLR